MQIASGHIPSLVSCELACWYSATNNVTTKEGRQNNIEVDGTIELLNVCVTLGVFCDTLLRRARANWIIVQV